MISQEDFSFIRDYDSANSERRDQLIQNLGPQCAKVFIRLMGRIAKEQTVRYILTMIDSMLKVMMTATGDFWNSGGSRLTRAQCRNIS